VIKLIISKSNKHSLFKSKGYFIDLTVSNKFIAGDSKRQIFKIYSIISSLNFEY